MNSSSNNKTRERALRNRIENTNQSPRRIQHMPVKDYIRMYIEEKNAKFSKIEGNIKIMKSRSIIPKEFTIHNRNGGNIIERIIKFLNLYIKQTNAITSKISSHTQTEEVIIHPENISKKEEEVPLIVSHLQEEVSNLTKENITLKIEKEKSDAVISELYQELSKIKVENQRMIQDMDDLKDQLEEKCEYIDTLEESVRLNNEEKYNIEDDSDNKNVSINKDTNPFAPIINRHKLLEITKFLQPSEIFSLKHSDRTLYLSIDNDPVILKQIFYYTINNKLLNSGEDKTDTSEGEKEVTPQYNRNLEPLLRKYHPNNDNSLDNNRKQLGATILKAIDYINKDINYYMKLNLNDGIRNNKPRGDNNNNSNSINSNLNPNVLNSFGGFMNKFVNQIFNQNSNQSTYSTSTTAYNTSTPSSFSKPHPASIEIEFLNFDKREHNFNFQSTSELKNLIYSCFFRVGELNNINYLKSYVEEISQFYSNLLFFSIEVLKEGCEMRLVKNSLFDFLKDIKEEKRELVKDYNELVRSNNSLSFINQSIEQDRVELRRKFAELEEERKLLNEKLQILSEENRLVKEKFKYAEDNYIDFKSLYKKQIVDFKSDLGLVTKERDSLVQMLKNIQGLVKLN